MEPVNTKAKISVIIPVYNGEEYLSECLDSVINQTFKDIEIFCVDDGSTDNTPSILKKYAKKDSRIRIITQKNGGAGAARNNALQYVTGEYLSILDADDFFELDMLEKAYRKVKETDSDIVVFRCNLYNTPQNKYSPCAYSIHEHLLPSFQPFSGIDIQRDVFRVFVGWAWDKLFRTEFVKKHQFRFQEQRTTNDLLFVFSSIVKAKKIVTMDDILAHHRRGIVSLSVTREKSWHCFYNALIALKDSLKTWGLYSRFEDDFINYSAGFSLWNLDTLAMPTKQLLYEKLHNEWLKELGVADYPLDKFYDKQEGYKCDKILRHQSYSKDGDQIKVSVVLPSLNVAPYIRECLESAINQTMQEIEIICVDAGSTDGTLEILEEYAQKDTRIRILHSPVRSYGYQMNLGMDAARGEYFSILETDDYIKPLMFEELYQLAEDNYLDIIKPDFSIFVSDENNLKHFIYQAIINTKVLRYNQVYTPADNFDTFKAKNHIWTGLYDLSFLRCHKIRFHESPGAAYQDNGFWFLTMCYAHRIMYFERDYYMLRRDNPNSSVHSKGKVYCICDEYDYIRSELKKNPKIESTFVYILAQSRFRNYEWTYSRIGNEFKDAFLERFSHDFKVLLANGEIHGEYFNMEESFRLKMIIKAPDTYKYYRLAAENRENNKTYNPYTPEPASKKLDRTKKELDRVCSSVSYKIGRVITWVPRKILDGVQCLSKCGLKCTIKKVFNLGKENETRQPAPPVHEFHRDYRFYSSLNRDYYRSELLIWYKKALGTDQLNLNYPVTFNEKMQWLKLYDSTPLKTMLTDKYQVRNYVAKAIGEDYLVPLLGVWNKFDDIDFSTLPNRFLLRTNNGRNTSIVVSDKKEIDVSAIKERLNHWLSTNYAFVNGFELQYLKIEPKIIAEAFLEDIAESKGYYRVFCFNGKAAFVQYIVEREEENPLIGCFDLEWNRLSIVSADSELEGEVVRPERLSELITISEKLSEEFVQTCVSLFILRDGSIKFKNLDFTLESGLCKWADEEVNKQLGELIVLPLRSPIPKHEGMEVFKREAMGMKYFLS